LGGGLFVCDGVIQSNTVSHNRAGGYSGGLSYCSASIRNNIVSFNSFGGLHNCNGRIINCIVWGNLYGQIWGSPEVTYSNIQGGWPGEGNINADPCFADVNNGDYHLKSQAGRWDANEGRWTKDEVTSLCIDAGDPASPIGLEPFPNGGIINMGAYGGTEQASKSYFGEPVCETIVAGDINGDCKVDFKDFALMAFHWLEER